MSSARENDGTRLKSMMKRLNEAQGADRLKLWLEFSLAQDKDPELQNWMSSCVPFLKLHSWSMDDPNHPKVVFKPGFWFWLGVSRTLNVTYLKPIPLGEEILVEAEILSIGRKLATIRGTMTRESDGALLTVCEHGKVNTDPETSSKI
ncbi:hypothetical protein DHEL01_v206925 [Diaporthe helianthi]|uniref:Thioesterase domain-containing protein n=1 Tax=Diaporthe helianthi TaxID=158607 RepID=A0A2P5HWR3_DIAHE|nr:hypothetical protein DHEL01_v206925 [Diaporthe helianthi]